MEIWLLKQKIDGLGLRKLIGEAWKTSPNMCSHKLNQRTTISEEEYRKAVEICNRVEDAVREEIRLYSTVNNVAGILRRPAEHIQTWFDGLSNFPSYDEWDILRVYLDRCKYFSGKKY